MKDFLRCPILEKKEVWMKFHVGIVVSGQMMNRDKIFMSFMNMKHIIEIDVLKRGF